MKYGVFGFSVFKVSVDRQGLRVLVFMTTTSWGLLMKGCVENDLELHQIDRKILLANCFSLPSMNKENSI